MLLYSFHFNSVDLLTMTGYCTSPNTLCQMHLFLTLLLLELEDISPQLPVPHRPKPDILDVPEDESLNSNHVHLVGPNRHDTLGQQGQHIYTEYQSFGHGTRGQQQPLAPHHGQPLVYIPLPGPDGHRVPLVKVSEGPMTGLAFEFHFNETDLPQEAHTQTTITWQPVPDSSEYVVSCSPVTETDEKTFQVSTLVLTHGFEPGFFWLSRITYREIRVSRFTYISKIRAYGPSTLYLNQLNTH